MKHIKLNYKYPELTLPCVDKLMQKFQQAVLILVKYISSHLDKESSRQIINAYASKKNRHATQYIWNLPET